MTMNKKLVFFVSLLSLSASLFATRNPGIPKQVAMSGLFITGDFGYSRLFTPDSNLNASQPGSSFDRNTVAWSAGFGYNVALDTYSSVGVEADYFDAGRSTYYQNGNDLQINLSALGIMFYFNTLWNNGVNVFLKAGPAGEQEVNAYSAPLNVNGYTRYGSKVSYDITGIGVIGVGYYLFHNCNLFADVTYIYGHSRGGFYYVKSGGNIENLSTDGLGPASLEGKLGLSYLF